MCRHISVCVPDWHQGVIEKEIFEALAETQFVQKRDDIHQDQHHRHAWEGAGRNVIAEREHDQLRGLKRDSRASCSQSARSSSETFSGTSTRTSTNKSPR